MTEELKQTLERDLETALESGDSRQIDKALVNSNRAVIACQQKMAERVKTIAANQPVLVEDVKEIKALVQKAKRKVWGVGLTAIKWIVVGGGGVEFIRFLITGME